MYDSAFQILFLGENLAWSKLTEALAEAPDTPINVVRANSLPELLSALAAGYWQSVTLDVHAWNFQGLHFVEKVRGEYPAIPILALYSTFLKDLDTKAITSGASRCLPLELLTAESLHTAVVSCISEKKSKALMQKVPPMQLSADVAELAAFPSSKAQVISHALNNLLCVITANAEILADQMQNSGPGVKSLSEIKRAAKSAADLTRQIK
jgi:CheY-like chemotaxis protein